VRYLRVSAAKMHLQAKKKDWVPHFDDFRFSTVLWSLTCRITGGTPVQRKIIGAPVKYANHEKAAETITSYIPHT
jgi:hypothetical protein